jgi:hypothetical protein
VSSRLRLRLLAAGERRLLICVDVVRRTVRLADVVFDRNRKYWWSVLFVCTKLQSDIDTLAYRLRLDKLRDLMIMVRQHGEIPVQ